jgi:hypothetical protein
MSTVKYEENRIIKGQTTKSNLHGWKINSNVTVDFEGADEKTIRALAADAAVIRFRQKTGVKDLPEADAEKMLKDAVIRIADLGKIERVKHAESDTEKRLKIETRKQLALLITEVGPDEYKAHEMRYTAKAMRLALEVIENEAMENGEEV